MSDKPAFPICIWQGDYHAGHIEGLSKREYAAIHAMQGILANSGISVEGKPAVHLPELTAQSAVAQADALLAELSKSEKKGRVRGMSLDAINNRIESYQKWISSLERENESLRAELRAVRKILGTFPSGTQTVDRAWRLMVNAIAKTDAILDPKKSKGGDA